MQDQECCKCKSQSTCITEQVLPGAPNAGLCLTREDPHVQSKSIYELMWL